MFSSIGMTAAALVTLQVLFSLAVSWFHCERAIVSWVRDARFDKQRKALRKEERDLGVEGWYDHNVSVFKLEMFVRKFLSRCWLVADLYFLACGVPAHASRVRVACLVEVALCWCFAYAAGAGAWGAFGQGAAVAGVMFAVGGAGLYSGRLAGSEGDKRIFGLA
jgi:hypothetical protein